MRRVLAVAVLALLQASAAPLSAAREGHDKLSVLTSLEPSEQKLETRQETGGRLTLVAGVEVTVAADTSASVETSGRMPRGDRLQTAVKLKAGSTTHE